MEGGLRLQTRRAFLQHMIPQYRKASTVKKKNKLLDAFTATTGYNRKYAMWLLNHAQEGQHPPELQHPRHYGPDVQHALFLVWHAANRICAKRLIPYLPTLVEALERHEHLHLTEECRSQLLSMSAATADRSGRLTSAWLGRWRGDFFRREEMCNEMVKASKEAGGIICSTSEKDGEGEVNGTIALLSTSPS